MSVTRRLRRWSAAAVVIVTVVGPSCAPPRAATTTSLVPLVAPEALPVSTVAPSTTAAPSSDPNSPLVAAVPEMECAFADRLTTGEISFVVGDRLYGAAPDGTVLRCLAS